MFVYWTMFAVPALSSILMGSERTLNTRRSRIGLNLLLVAFAIVIGLRYQVGGDWFNYIRTLDLLAYSSFANAVSYKDAGFGLVAWISTRIGADIYGADFFCGAILIYGLAKFARRQPDAWLAVTAAVPYLVIVVGMGYVRQAAAIGFVMLALIQFEQRSYYRFLGWMGAAALFHAGSLCILPLAALVMLRKRRDLILPLMIVAGLLYFFVLRDRLSAVTEYTDAQMDSSGALVRLFMNAVPSVMFFIIRKRICVDDQAKALWSLFSVVSIAMVMLFEISPSTTLLDRIGLYFIPIQLFVFGHLPVTIDSRVAGGRLVAYFVIFYYAAVLFVWSTYSAHASAWLPYQFMPLF